MEPYKKLSQFLSLILRHKPQVIGLSLDESGYIPVDDLIQAINQQGNDTITKDILDTIVKTDSKQRYSYNTDQTKIRANQGHSIPVKLGCLPQQPPNVLYHGTADKSLSGIFGQGILPQNRQYVHLSKDIETATIVGKRHGHPVVLEINAKDMFQDNYEFLLSENQVWLTKQVPPQYIRLMKSTNS